MCAVARVRGHAVATRRRLAYGALLIAQQSPRAVPLACARSARAPSDAAACRRSALCDDHETRGRVVFRRGDLMGFYYGRLHAGARDGDYVLYDAALDVSIDAAAYGSLFKYANGLPHWSRCNGAFRGAAGRRREVRALGTVREHDEVLIWYDAQYDWARVGVDTR